MAAVMAAIVVWYFERVSLSTLQLFARHMIWLHYCEIKRFRKGVNQTGHKWPFKKCQV
jgi:hypothetical protein